MFRTIAIVVFVAALIWVLYRLLAGKKKRDESAAGLASEDLASLDITQARVGDTISIAGAGRDYGDLDLAIDRRDRYEGAGQTWFELSGRYAGRRIYVEVIDADRLGVNATLDDVDVSIGELGLSEEMLAEMDERESRDAGFDWDGAQWTWYESGEIEWFEGSRAGGETFYSWSFRSADHRRWVSVAKWDGSPFKVTVSREIDPASITVYRS